MNDTNEALADLMLHYETILRWILSCNKSDQIPVCKEAVQELIIKRFTPKLGDDNKTTISVLELKEVVADLTIAMEEQKLKIAGQQFDERQNTGISGHDDLV